MERQKDILRRIEGLRINLDKRSQLYRDFEECVAWIQGQTPEEGARIWAKVSLFCTEETEIGPKELAAWWLDKGPVTISPFEEMVVHLLLAFYKASQCKSMYAGSVTGAL